MSAYRYQSMNYNRPSLFGGFRYFPPVIKYLLITNVALYVFLMFFGLFRIQGEPIGPTISYIFALYPLGGGFQIYQLVTYMFMHGGLMHLLFNMFALWMFGMELENLWGAKKFLQYYLICGVGAGLANLLIAPLFGAVGPTVGASGAIYGVLLAFGMLFPDRPIFLYFLLPIKARYFVILYIVLELYAGITGTTNGIAHFAHLGGAAVGFAYLLIDQRRIPFRALWEKSRERHAARERVAEYSIRREEEISDAKFYDIRGDQEDRVDQERIDEILDKISQSGYQSLSEAEKKILFEASKKLN